MEVLLSGGIHIQIVLSDSRIMHRKQLGVFCFFWFWYLSYKELAIQKLVFAALTVITAHYAECPCLRSHCCLLYCECTVCHIWFPIHPCSLLQPIWINMNICWAIDRGASASCQSALKPGLLKKQNCPPLMNTFRKADWLQVSKATGWQHKWTPISR